MAERAGARENNPEIDIDVVIEAGDWAFLAPVDSAIAQTARAVAEALEVREPGRFAATLALMNDAGIAVLNQNFRDKHGPTNVLSFPAGPLAGGGNSEDEPRAAGAAHERPTAAGGGAMPSPHYLGDIAMARETILKEAQELNISPGNHFRHLLAHGVLHLFGYDHDTEDAANEMENLEISILGRIGIANPYRDCDT